jgi:hypothetical protein
MMFVLSHTIIETSYKPLRVSIGVTRFTELRPLFTSTFALQKKKLYQAEFYLLSLMTCAEDF